MESSALIGATVVSSQGEGAAAPVLGSITDLVLNLRANRVSHVLVKSRGAEGGERLAAIEFNKLHYQRKLQRFAVPMTPEQLAAESAFDVDRLDDFYRDAARMWAMRKKVREAGHTEGKAGGDAKPDVEPAASKGLATEAHPTGFARSSELVKLAVVSQEKPLGATAGCVFEVRGGSIAFVTVGMRDKTRAFVPAGALELAAKENEKRWHLVLDIDPAQVGSMPKVAKDAKSGLNDAATRASLYAFYGVEPPRFEVGNEPKRREEK
ncbi:MAG: PRC-barrel domain containing protein [bacterium]|nr:PRC-barrel domain containing protein [bacterium]